MMEVLIFIAIGALSGVISGLGIGGGTLLIPALVILTRMGQQEAQNINLLYFIPTAVIAIVTHHKQGNIMKKEAISLALWGLPAAMVGAFIAIKIDANLLKKGFGLFLLAMGIYEFLSAKQENKQNGKRVAYMEIVDFISMKQQFETADVDSKINMYVEAEGLTAVQYRELLQLFPLSELGRLEAALGS